MTEAADFVLAIDIGGTKISAALVDALGRVYQPAGGPYPGPRRPGRDIKPGGSSGPAGVSPNAATPRSMRSVLPARGKSISAPDG